MEHEAVRTLLLDAARRAVVFLEGLDERRVFPEEAALSRLDEALAGALPDEPSDAQDVLARIDELGSPAAVASAGGRYFGFVTGGTLPAALATNWLASAWDQNAFSHASAPGVARFEQAALRWTKQALDLPESCAGTFVTGATMASFTGLAAARHAVLRQVGWDVGRRGLFGAPEIRVVVGGEAHATIFKVLAMLGLGRERVVVVPADDQGRMRVDALPALEGPTIVCLQAGNVNSGAFDPAAEIVPRVKAHGAWVHVDGAFGLWARASTRLAELGRGLELADSWAVDAHKWLNVPYDCAIALVRDAEALRSAFRISGAYLPQGDRAEAIDVTPESSRRARGLDVWAALKSLGRRGIAELVERHCRQAATFAAGLRAAGHEVLNDVVLNQVVVAFGDAARTDAVIAALQRAGVCWCGATIWRGRRAMRISVSSWATTDEDVRAALASIDDAARAR